MAKKRTKKYRPRDVRAPILIRTLLKGEKMTSVELAMINRIVTGSLDLVQLMTMDVDAYRAVDTACRHLYILAGLYEGQEENRRLAQYARAFLAALWQDLRRPDQEQLFAHRPECRRTLMVVLEHVRRLLEQIYPDCTMVELDAMEQALTRVPKPVADGWLIELDPDEVAPPETLRPGATTYLHGRIMTGRLSQEGDDVFFHADEGVRIRVQEPIFLIFTD